MIICTDHASCVSRVSIHVYRVNLSLHIIIYTPSNNRGKVLDSYSVGVRVIGTACGTTVPLTLAYVTHI